MKTIRRNSTKKISEILENAETFTYYTLDNGFTGEEKRTPSARFIGFIQDDIQAKTAKMIDNENGTYTIQYHSNLWIDVK